MERLSAALASELQARLAETAEVGEEVEGARNIQERKSQGARLFVEGTVQQAAWTRPDSGGGDYRIQIELSATLAKEDGTDIQDFWTKTVELEEPHRGWPAQELAWAVHKGFSEAVDELGKKVETELATAAQQAAEEQPASEESAEGEQ
jgi:single-stranded DNA-binding protein